MANMRKKLPMKVSDEVNLSDYDLNKGRKTTLAGLASDLADKRTKDAFLNMRMDAELVEWLKKQAAEEGLPYQSYIHRKLTLLKNGRLIETSEIESRVRNLEKKVLKGA